MRKTYRPIRRKGNVVLFPGTYERIVTEAFEAFERKEYAQAVERFEAALAIEPEAIDLYGPFAYALYECKQYDRSKTYVEQLLERDPDHYFEWMELYITLSIQLKQYDYVETAIDGLFEEGLIPEHLTKKFIYLRQLNDRLLHTYDFLEEDPVESALSFETFEQMPLDEQLQTLAQIENNSPEHALPLLLSIVQSSSLSPLIQTHSLVLLKEVGFDERVRVMKYGVEKIVVPSELPYPTDHLVSEEVKRIVRKQLEKSPTEAAVAERLIDQYVLFAYPLEWDGFSIEEVAHAYIAYVRHLYHDVPLDRNELIEQLERVDRSAERLNR